MRWRTALVTMALAAAAVLPAGADALLRTERVYFTCAGATKVQNLSATLGELPGWDTQAPQASVTDGAGCGFYDNAVWISSEAPDETWRATWVGTFTGNLDALTIEAHNIYVGEARVDGPFEGGVRLVVDGEQVVQSAFQAVPERSDTGLSEALHISLTDLGFVDEDGEGDTVRTLRVELGSSGETQSAWVWDTTEVPAGITFNPDELADTVISAAD